MKNLKRNDIREECGNRHYQRGLDYFNVGLVSSLEYEEIANGFIVHSVVKSSTRNSYKQRIEVTLSDLFDTNIDGDCSCPVGFNCKHVVAACLQLQKTLESGVKTERKPDLRAALGWLDNMAASCEEKQPQDPSSGFIAYVLDFSNKKGILEVKLLATKPLKKGGLSKGRAIQLYAITYNYYSSGYVLQDIDKEISKLLDAIQSASMYNNVGLYGELGFVALSKILQTGRCFWRSTQGTSLQLSDARALKLQWKKKSDSAVLQTLVEPAGQLLLTEPPLYLDADDGVIGALSDVPYSLDQLEKLQQVPSVPLELADEFSRKLITALPGLPLPPPGKVELLTIENEQPQPVLMLFGETMSPDKHVHMMRLRFAYSGYELSLHPQTEWRNLEIDNKLLRVHRDLSAEEEAIGLLLSLGFDPMNNGEGDIAFASLSQNISESAGRWQRFIEEVVPELTLQGWQIKTGESFHLKFHQSQDWDVEIEGENDWFDLRFDIEVNGKKVPLLPLVVQLLSEYDQEELPKILTLPLGEHEYLTLPSEQIKPVLDTLYELYNSDSLSDDGSLRMSRFDAARLAELDENSEALLRWQGGEALRELGRKLKDFKGIATAVVPDGLQATLRDYQRNGLNWLQFLREYRFGGVLADDMGLGKTVQTLTHLLLEKSEGRMDKPCLVIAPTSLMSNWRREAEQFTPELKVLVLQGPMRRKYFDQIENYDLILSTYPLLVRDETHLLAHEYHYVVLDEAQIIKNPRAKAARVVRQFKAENRLCLTGTPMENHLGELWALFDFAMPGLLGSDKQFKQLFRTPIEKHGNDEQRARLTKRIAPFMLRRTKTEVVTELPEKTEIIRTVSLGKKQATLYESIRLTMEKKVRDSIASKGLARSHIMILDALLKLRQTCCDPAILSLKQAQAVKESAKMELLMDMVPEMLEEGRRILLFSQFTKMLAIIEDALKDRGIAYSKLTGQTRKRDEAIEQFKSGQVNIFLISLKAGGVGLNLAEADTVIHYDPWWNPAAENQATDRAHRIGQKNAVFVYKLITENTLEEKILMMQAKKQALAQGVYGSGKKEEGEKLSADDLKALFEPLQ